MKKQQLKGGRLSSRNKHLGAALPGINLHVVATKDYFAFLFRNLSKSVSFTYLLLYRVMLLINDYNLCAVVIHNVHVTLISLMILSFSLILKAGHDLIPCMFITFQQCLTRIMTKLTLQTILYKFLVPVIRLNLGR